MHSQFRRSAPPSLRLAAILAGALALIGGPRLHAAEAANVVVDFTAHRQPTSAYSLGSTVSTFADGGSNLIKGPNQALWQRYLGELGPLVWRIPLYHHDGQVGSAAGGVHGGNEGEAYVRAIKSIGGIPMIAVGGSSNDNDIRAGDAAALVRYFNDNGGSHGGPVDDYIIGNEPDNGFGMDPYIHGGNGSDGFHAIAVAMRGASARPLSIAGPSLVTWADYKFGDFRKFFAARHADVDVVDFHKYGDGERVDNLRRTGQYADAIAWLRQEIDASFGDRASGIAIQVGEFNYNSWYDGSWRDAFYTSRNLVHTASVIGHVLNAGGSAYQYADNNGPLGLITDGTDRNDQPQGQHVRLPAYWGLSVWTGGTWSRRYGSTMVAATSAIPELEVFATDDRKKIVLVNKSASLDRRVVMDLRGQASGVYSAWRHGRGMNPADFAAGAQFRAPTRIANAVAFAQGRVVVQVPWMSVVVVTVD
ncbi:hypothetical protein [Lysobacter firmicutimachus]|uniref:Alpha-L-arabinofuranosidase n=1 Tax=Lysobacter firmicutimachus TaxID=1792846 RepID=A0ABU8D5B5_9GAMM